MKALPLLAALLLAAAPARADDAARAWSEGLRLTGIGMATAFDVRARGRLLHVASDVWRGFASPDALADVICGDLHGMLAEPDRWTVRVSWYGYINRPGAGPLLHEYRFAERRCADGH